MTLSFSNFSFSGILSPFFGPAMPQPSSRAEPEPVSQDEADQFHADRAFARDMMAQNPEAFQSEHGMMLFMAHYPKYF